MRPAFLLGGLTFLPNDAFGLQRGTQTTGLCPIRKAAGAQTVPSDAALVAHLNDAATLGHQLAKTPLILLLTLLKTLAVSDTAQG